MKSRNLRSSKMAKLSIRLDTQVLNTTQKFARRIGLSKGEVILAALKELFLLRKLNNCSFNEKRWWRRFWKRDWGWKLKGIPKDWMLWNYFEKSFLRPFFEQRKSKRTSFNYPVKEKNIINTLKKINPKSFDETIEAALWCYVPSLKKRIIRKIKQRPCDEHDLFQKALNRKTHRTIDTSLQKCDNCSYTTTFFVINKKVINGSCPVCSPVKMKKPRLVERERSIEENEKYSDVIVYECREENSLKSKKGSQKIRVLKSLN